MVGRQEVGVFGGVGRGVLEGGRVLYGMGTVEGMWGTGGTGRTEGVAELAGVGVGG